MSDDRAVARGEDGAAPGKRADFRRQCPSCSDAGSPSLAWTDENGVPAPGWMLPMLAEADRLIDHPEERGEPEDVETMLAWLRGEQTP